jgi:hypothetical protein
LVLLPLFPALRGRFGVLLLVYALICCSNFSLSRDSVLGFDSLLFSDGLCALSFIFFTSVFGQPPVLALLVREFIFSRLCDLQSWVVRSVLDPCLVLKLTPKCLRAAWSLHFLLAVCLLGLQFRCRYSDFGWSAHGVVLVDCCRKEAGIFLELPN